MADKDAYTGKHARVTDEMIAEAQGEKKKGKAKKVVLIVLAVLIVLFAVAYGVGAYFFSSHFYPNTTFNTEDISFESGDEFVTSVEESVPGYVLNVTGENFDLKITSAEVGLKVDATELRNNAFKSQNIWAWPVELFSDHDVSDVIQADFDQAKAAALAKPAIEEYNKTAKPSVDAQIVYDKLFNTLIVQEEVYGNKVDPDLFVATLDDCLRGMQDSYELDELVFIQPNIFKDDERFKEALPAARDLVSGEIELTMAEGAVSGGTITKDLIVSWLSLDPETLMPSLNQEAIVAWANEKTAELNTVGSKRTYKRADGKEVTVSGGTYGWKVNTTDLAATIIANLTTGNFEAIDMPCTSTAEFYNGPGQREWGPYVDIDISQQTVRYYDANDQLLYSAPCVTGDSTIGRSTPSGVYFLRLKKSPEILVGLKPDGTKDYESHVTYWMPFIRNSIGLHDATWRGNFGGSIYRGNGSHGCVNLSTKDAKWFYENLPVGTVVVVHG